MKRSEVPGPGFYERFNTQETVRVPAGQVPINQGSPAGNKTMSSTFKDATSRDDFKSYLAHDMKKPPVAPTDYFTEQRPFLKKTFNASLPPARFV